MQILFVHQNFPAQFGHVAAALATRYGVDCVFVSKSAAGVRAGIRCVQYALKGGATRNTHHCARTFENGVWQAHAVYEACKAERSLRPDLIVGHSGFGSTAFLPELYGAPIVNYFEYYYHPHGSDMDFRPEFPPRELDFLRARMRNAMILVDLAGCRAGYTPTRWQHSLLPAEWRSKVEVIHDGIDTGFWTRRAVPRRLGEEMIPESTRIVTFVARGLEAMRGFDIFVRVANRIAAAMPDVLFLVVGSDRVAYGDDLRHVTARTFREHVIASEQPDVTRFRFLGTVPPSRLAEIFSMSDLHIYLTVPFVLSWSLLDALACGCTVVASNTPPVREVIEHERTGLLADFFDVEELAQQALRVLRDPRAFRPLGDAGRALVEQRYAASRTLPRLWELFTQVATGATAVSRSPGTAVH
jgi:glycosyltransferase involved in cell wall biosynthesis